MLTIQWNISGKSYRLCLPVIQQFAMVLHSTIIGLFSGDCPCVNLPDGKLLRQLRSVNEKALNPMVTAGNIFDLYGWRIVEQSIFDEDTFRRITRSNG